MEGASLPGHEAQKEQQTRGHGGAPGQPDSTDWRPKQCQEAGETNHQCMEGQDGGGVAGQEKSGRTKAEHELGQWGNAESNCKYTCLQDMTNPEVRLNKFIHCSLDACLLFSLFQRLDSTHWYNKR